MLLTRLLLAIENLFFFFLSQQNKLRAHYFLKYFLLRPTQLFIIITTQWTRKWIRFGTKLL